MEPRSGYDIKALTDKSTRFFWAASYGQIYPELRRLSEQGLVSGADGSQGERKRTVWSITPAGQRALREWLSAEEQTHELRDEGLLKLFFAGVADPEEVANILREKRAAHLASLEELRAIEPLARTAERFGPHEVLGYGLAFNEFAVAWCDKTLKEIEKET